MGWLEVLALLKRLLPLLNRVAPMLETFVAARGGARADVDAAAERLSSELKLHAEAGGRAGADLQQAIERQGSQIGSLAAGVAVLRRSAEAEAARMEAVERQLKSLRQSLLWCAVALAVAMAATLLLLSLLLHRPR